MSSQINFEYDGQIQQEWRWILAIYLFLGGVGGGAYAIGALASLRGGPWEQVMNVGVSLGFPLLVIGTFFLIADLGMPMRFMKVIARPGDSWISRGAWIISVFMLIAFIHFIGLIWPSDFVAQAYAAGAGWPTALSVLGVIFAFLVMVYTGALLGASKGIPFWRDGLVPPLFLASALFTGLMAVMVGMAWTYGDQVALGTYRLMGLAGAVLILVEGLILLLHLHTSYKKPDTKQSAMRIMSTGSFIFWDLIVGLALPFVLLLAMWFSMGTSGAGSVLTVGVIAGICGLIGGLMLRGMILNHGMLNTINTAGYQFRRVYKPKEPKPAVGKLPPA